MKKIAEILQAHGAHWVGDGFPVRTLFAYDKDAAAAPGHSAAAHLPG